MKLNLYLLTFFLLLLKFTSCSDKTVEEKLIGNWKLVEIYDGKKYISQERNPKNHILVEFKIDGTYFTTGAPYAPKTGKWFYKPINKVLFMDSDAGSGDDTKWSLEFKNDTIEFRGKSPFIKTVLAKWVKY